MHNPSYQLAHGANLELSAKAFGRQAGQSPLVAIQGGGKGCLLRVEGPLASVSIALRGRVQLGTGTEAPIQAGELRVSDTEPRLQLVGRGNALWLTLIGTPSAWRRQYARSMGGHVAPEPLLLPAVHDAERTLRRQAIRVARARDEDIRSVALDALVEGVLALQRGFEPAIARCPGRTYAQRRQVFVRLQRVRNYLSANCHLDVDNDALARMANYSPWHFIRAFRAAYGETPHAYLVRQRLEHARRLLHASPLAVAEIALASGFENRCAFSRLFRQHFGTTAGAMRRAGKRAPQVAATALP